MAEFDQAEFEQIIAAILAAGAGGSSPESAHYNYTWILAEIRKLGLDAYALYPIKSSDRGLFRFRHPVSPPLRTILKSETLT